MVDKNALAVKQRLKKDKPVFIRHDAHKKKRVGVKWRRPKGRQNKMRLNKRGYKKGLRFGYASPVALRGHYYKDGRALVTIRNVTELDGVDNSKQIIVLGSCGTRKKYDIVKAALAKNLDIMNVDDAQGFVKSVEDLMKGRKEDRKLVEDKRKKKDDKKPKKSIEEKVKEKKTDEPEKTAEEEKLEKKKEQDKVLTNAKEQY